MSDTIYRGTCSMMKQDRIEVVNVDGDDALLFGNYAGDDLVLNVKQDVYQVLRLRNALNAWLEQSGGEY